MQPISEALKSLMKSSPELTRRMNDAKESLVSNPIVIQTTPSDKCSYKKCDGKGWLWYKDWSRVNKKDEVDENGKQLRAEWMEKCPCHDQLVKQREVNKILDLSNVPPIFKNATVASFSIDKYELKESKEIAEIAKKAAANYVTNFDLMLESGKGVYLYSQIKGSGKTRLASSIANALVNVHGIDIAFIKSADLMDQVFKTMDKKSETSKSDVIKTFREVGLLVIDDLAIKGASEFEEGVLYDVFDYRLEHKKPTIFTSNVTIMELEEYYPGGRVNKRINKIALEVYMPEESIRDLEADSEDAELEKILFN